MSAPAATRLVFRILGPLEVLRDGKPLEMGPRKHRALLALLLLSANRPVSTDRLIEELWAGRPPPGAAKTLRSYVSRLRALVGDEVVRSRPPGYGVEIEPDQLDADRFERLLSEGRTARARGDAAEAALSLRKALAVWRGDALADLADEPFAAIEARRLDELRLEAVEERIDADLECGRHGQLVAELEALVVVQPLRERLWRQLMTALYWSGRQADALAAYRRARSLLADEVGLDTGLELRTLEQKILHHELEPASAPAHARRLPTGTVTLVFTDIEGSTRLLHELGERYPDVLSDHRRTLRDAFAHHGGVEVEMQGDGFFVVFASANDAVAAAREAQEALASSPVRVRIGIHTGEPNLTDEGYVGVEVHRAARVMSAGHGGQVLLSQATRELLGATAHVRDLGEHHLKGLPESQRLYQLGQGDFPPLRTLHRSNLPIQLTSFVGRNCELDELVRLLPETPLVTLIGVGGSGKTRLALEAAGRVLSRFPDGVLLVELAGLTSPEFVAHAVAAQLEAQPRSERPVLELLADALRSQALLIVLDNCEHLLDGCAELAGGLLSLCPQLRILATSREPLGLPGELVYRVPPLPLAGPGAQTADVAASEAVRLFLERASVAGWEEADSPAETLATVAAICRELDGLPLALELAAARTDALTLEEIAARLDDRFRFLRYWRRNPEPRHETLGATMAWSYDLLSEDEQMLLRRLSVFAGGFTLEAAAAVCLDDDAVAALALLTRLIDASLVVADPVGGRTRYRMLETVRHYARERLAAAGEEDETRTRHARYFAGDPEDAARFRPRDAATERLWRTNPEIENMRAALDWANGARSELALALAVLYQRANAVFPGEGRVRLERALANSSSQRPQMRARALGAAGGLARLQGDFTSARRYLEESLRLYRENHDQHGELVVLARLQEVATESGDEVAALAVASDVEALARRTGDSPMLSDAVRWRAIRALAVGDTHRARELLAESLALLHPGRARGEGAIELGAAEREGDVHTLLAIAEILDGRFREAVAEAVAGLERFSTVGEDYGGKWDSIDVLAAALAAAGDVTTGVGLHAAARRGRETRGDATPWILSSLREQIHARLEQALTLPEYAATAADGQRMTLDEAVIAGMTAARRVVSGAEQTRQSPPEP